LALKAENSREKETRESFSASPHYARNRRWGRAPGKTLVARRPILPIEQQFGKEVLNLVPKTEQDRSLRIKTYFGAFTE
jgi:hypothetical protein